MKRRANWEQYLSSTVCLTGSNLFLELLDDVQQCGRHELDYIIGQNWNKRYRKYRRGKNRCQRCGVKLDGGLNETKDQES